MIKVLAVVVIAGGLWWFLKGGDPSADCVADGGTWTEAVEAVVCGDGAAADCVAAAAVEGVCTPAAE